MEVNYEFVPQYKSVERKMKSDVISYAGKLLEITCSELLIVSLDDENRPIVFESNCRLTDALNFHLETY